MTSFISAARKALFLTTVAASLSGCDKHALRYDDDLDVTAIQETFGCAHKAASGERAQACRMLEDFKTASTFAEWPKKGVDTWFGRKVCSDSIDVPDQIAFGHVLLHAGVGKPTFADNVKTDPSRDVPVGAEFLGTSAAKMSPAMMRGYVATIAGAEKGVEPELESSLSDLDHGALVAFWDRIKKPPGNHEFGRLVQSTGNSVLGGPLTKDAVEKTPSGAYFIRAVGLRMLVVYPSWAKPPVPCVAELWKVHSTE